MSKSFLVLSSATKAREVAEERFKARDLESAIRFAAMAKQLDPTMDSTDATLVAYKVHMAASKKRDNGETDWCKVLGVMDVFADFETKKKQYKKMAIMVHPDKNGSAAAEGAFKLITQALIALSNPSYRRFYDYGSAPRSSDQARHAPPRSRVAAKSTKSTRRSTCVAKVEREACPKCSRWCKYESRKCSIITCPNCKRKFDPKTSSASDVLSSPVRINRSTNRFPIKYL